MSTTDYQILKSLLSYEFYEANRQFLRADLFEAEGREVFEAVARIHEEAPGTDVAPDTIMSVWRAEHPAATRTERDIMSEFVRAVGATEPMPAQTTRRVIKALWSRAAGRQIANFGIEISEGRDKLIELRALVDRLADGYGPDEFGAPTTQDLDELLDLASDERRFAFNIPTVKRLVYGIGRGEFGILFATPETGKTALAVSLCFGPDGYAAQGARCLYLVNEEASARTMLRAYSAWTGLTRAQIAENKISARQRFAAIAERVQMRDVQGWSLEQVEAYVKHVGADVVVLDQADKVQIGGAFNAGHERLRALYQNLREVAKRQNCALWAVSQASNDAAGKSHLTLHDMEGSKIGKAAEADIIIGVGKVTGEDDDPTRYLNLCKNKISGVHEKVACRIVHQLSRYEA